MANTFLTPSIIAREALMILENNLVMGNLVYRAHAREWGGQKVGDTISIRKPASFVQKEWTSGISVQNATETSVSLQLEKHFDISLSVTSADWTLELEEFSNQIVRPVMVAHAQGLDAYILSKYVETWNHIGTAGDPPDSWADAVAIWTRMNEMQVPFDGNVNVVMNPVATGDLLGLAEFHAADVRGDTGTALRTASFGTVLNMNWWMDQNVPSHTTGTYDTGSVTTSAEVAAGAAAMVLGGGATTGTIKIGDVFTVPTTIDPRTNQPFQGRITANATAIAGAIATAAFEPAAPATIASGAAIDFLGATVTSPVSAPTAHRSNLAFHRNAFSLATVPLDRPMGAAQSEIMTANGMSVRVVYGYDMDTKADTISFDFLAGAKCIDPRLALRIAG